VRGLKTTLTMAVAIGLLAGSAVGVAAQDGGATVTGTADYVSGFSFDDGDAGRVVIKSPGVIIETSDPRLSGTADITTYGVHGFDGDGFTETHFGSDVLTLVNEEGSWSGRGISALLLDDTNNPTVMEATWHLTGEGAYEGLTAYLNVMFWEFVEGVIVEGTSATLEPLAE
jgi:hypothetical protein